MMELLCLCRSTEDAGHVTRFYVTTIPHLQPQPAAAPALLADRPNSLLKLLMTALLLSRCHLQLH